MRTAFPLRPSIRRAVAYAALLTLAAGWNALPGAAQEEAAPAPAPVEKVAPSLRSALMSAKSQSLIVQLQEPVPAAAYAELKKAGAKITRRYETLPMVAAVAPGKSILTVAALNCVTRVSEDVSVQSAAR